MRRRHDAIGGKPDIHRRIHRRVTGVDVECRAPRRVARRHRLRDEAAVLQRAREAAHAYARGAGRSVGAARHQQQSRAGLVLGAHRQRKFDVVADRNARMQAVDLEHLQCIATFDHAGLLLEPGELQLVLPAMRAVGRKQVGTVAITPLPRVEQKGARDHMQIQITRQLREQRDPVAAMALDRGKRCMQVVAHRRCERRPEFQREILRQHRDARAGTRNLAQPARLLVRERGEIRQCIDRILRDGDLHASSPASPRVQKVKACSMSPRSISFQRSRMVMPAWRA